MRSTPVFLVLLAAGAPHVHSHAQQLAPAVKQLQVHARSSVPELTCETKAPAARIAAAPNPDPMEVPTEEMVQSLAAESSPQASARADLPEVPARPLRPLSANGGYRIAIWGDSHLAAGFFTEELARQLKFPVNTVSNALLPANMGKAGVRLPIRRSCISSQWKYEPGYLGGDNAAAPGPGLVNMFSDQTGATLAWDVRNNNQSLGYESVRILYEQTEAPMVIGISIDGDTETQVTLDQRPGPAVLELVSDQPVVQVKLRLIDARFRFHGLELLSQRANPYEMDVFGYPGATVASWKSAQPDYLRTWFAQRDYQLVVLEFGTNEGNAKPFDLGSYRKTLSESVQHMRKLFPTAACLLIAPGDRGVLVPRSANKKNPGASKRRDGKTPGTAHKRQAKPDTRIDLFQYSRIHGAIGQVQREVAADAGCSAWSMLDAMGGPGHAYDWARQSPALMSRDLIHFTVAGYQRLAQKLAKDLGWIAPPADSQ